MPKLPQKREGELLRVKDRPLEFSFWPVEKTTRRYGLGARVFATDPWTVIRRSIENQCPTISRQPAFALIEQSEDFYHASESGVKAAKPLLLYYCYMNLAKAFALQRNTLSDVDNAQHGLASKMHSVPSPNEIRDSFLEAYKSPNSKGQIQNFDVLLHAISGAHMPTRSQTFKLNNLLPQIVPGHRLWAQASSRRVQERFISIERIEFQQNRSSKQIWLRLFVFADDLKRLGMTHQNFIEQTQLGKTFEEVKSTESDVGRPLLCFEQKQPVNYNSRPSDQIPTLVRLVRSILWRTVLVTRPYRKYYLYAAPVSEHSEIVPQVLSIYAITYHLGSIVRYRPQDFDEILKSEFGPFIEAFLNDQSTQFIYLMASEFAEKEVTKAAIV